MCCLMSDEESKNEEKEVHVDLKSPTFTCCFDRTVCPLWSFQLKLNVVML